MTDALAATVSLGFSFYFRSALARFAQHVQVKIVTESD